MSEYVFGLEGQTREERLAVIKIGHLLMINADLLAALEKAETAMSAILIANGASIRREQARQEAELLICDALTQAREAIKGTEGEG